MAFSNRKGISLIFSKTGLLLLTLVVVLILIPGNILDLFKGDKGFNFVLLKGDIESCENGVCPQIKYCDDETECSDRDSKNWEKYLAYYNACKDGQNDNEITDKYKCDSTLSYKIKEVYEGVKEEEVIDSWDLSLAEEQSVNEKTGQCSTTSQGDLEPEFITKARQVSDSIEADLTDLLKFMEFESAGTFCPCIINPDSGAVGLIQFTDIGISALDITKAELCQMSRVEQLDYVEKYFLNVRDERDVEGRLSGSDLYMSILWPVAVGKDEDHIIFEEGTDYYAQNIGLDINNDGEVTVGEATQRAFS